MLLGMLSGSNRQGGIRKYYVLLTDKPN